MKIAIIGMSFRFPGTTQEQYWSDLLAGRDLITQVEEGRWAQETYRHPDKDHPGSSYTFAAGSIGDVSAFDAGFFGISPREAAQMDPQQRLLLEMSWEALDAGGIRASQLRGSRSAVFIGISSADYAWRFADDLGAVGSKVATGNTSSIAANRLSYFFDLRGPSMAVDTACSSSLVAFHQACQSLRSGESELAIAGGISLHLHPYGFVAFAKATMLSPRGRCRVFDASGDGYVRSEGGGIFILKPYEQAVADGNPILAVVGGSAVNADGHKNGLTVPSAEAQADLLRGVYESAGIDAADIDYIEAHGTGTAVGDPIETRALGVALGQRRTAGQPLLIGSVKSNLGHLEAASGVAGLVKAVCCVQHRAVPATIGIDTLNPQIDFAGLNLEVVTRPSPLKPAGRVVVGVNSFGFGGANAHVILESPAAPVARLAQGRSKAPSVSHGPLPLILSARSRPALEAAARALAGVLRAEPDSSLYDIAFTSAERERLDHRLLVRGEHCKSLAAMLDRFCEGKESPVIQGIGLPPGAGIAFAYSGNGSQWEGMAQGLMGVDPVFTSAVEQVDAHFTALSGRSLGADLGNVATDGRYACTELAQPALFAWQVGVTEMLRSRGIHPQWVTGHSVGEVAAAWAAGALSMEQAVQVIHHRSHLQETTRGRGQMTAAMCSREDVVDLLQQTGLGHDIEVAGFNSHRGVTLAGSVACLEQFESLLGTRGITFKRLELDYAFHSAAMDAIESPLYRALATLAPVSTRIPFISTVTGEELSGALLGAYYWWQNIRMPVLFAKSAGTLIEAGARMLVEIGPHAVLRGYLQDALKQSAVDGRVVATARRGQDAAGTVASALDQILVAMPRAEFPAEFPRRGRHVALPAYPWQRERHWLDPTPESIGLLSRRKCHPLLGYALTRDGLAWENQVDLASHPMLADHVVGDAAVFPAAGFAELAIAAAMQSTPREAVARCVEIEELEIHAPLLLDAEPARSIRLRVDEADGRFEITARVFGSSDDWSLHAVGRLPASPEDVRIAQETLVLPTRPPEVSRTRHLALTSAVGLNYGPAFNAVAECWLDGSIVTARLDLPPVLAEEAPRYHLHPALLDGAFQLIVHAMQLPGAASQAIAYVPVKIGRLVYLDGLGPPASARAELVRCSPHSLTAHFCLHDHAGNLVATLREVRFRSVRLRVDNVDYVRFLEYGTIPQPHPLAPEPAVQLAPALAEALAGAAKRIRKEGVVQAFAQEVEPLLDVLCSAYAKEALRAMADDTGVVSDYALLSAGGAGPGVRALSSRLLGILQEDELLARTDMGWRFRVVEDAATAHDIWNALLADHPAHFSILHAVGRVGLNLPAILAGITMPAATIPQDCTLGSLSADVIGPGARKALTDAMGASLAAALSRLDDGQRLRVLEISDGLPLFATRVLAGLPAGRCEYVFGTSNRETHEACEQRLERGSGVKRQLFGESADGASRAEVDAEAGRYHLVMLHNDFADHDAALHAMEHALRMLSPAGTLVFLGTPSSRWLDLIFGARETWWTPESDVRLPPATREADYWQGQFQLHGLACAPAQPLAPDIAGSPYVLVGTSTQRDPRPALATGGPRSWLLLVDEDDPAPWVGAVAGALREAGHVRIEAVPPAAGRADFDRALDAATPEGELFGIVHAHALAASADASSSERQARRCASIAALAQSAEAHTPNATCWIVTRDAHAPARDNGSAVWGFARSLMNEFAQPAIRLVDVPGVQGVSMEPLATGLVREMTAPDSETEVMLDAEGRRFVPRLRVAPRHATPEPRSHLSSTLRLGFPFPGQLRNLRWEEHPRSLPGADEIEIEVAATGLNFRDVMYSLGLLSDEAVENGFAGATLGLECAGVVIGVGSGVDGFGMGDRVVAFGPSSFSNHVMTRSLAVSRIPPGMSFEAAATIPSTFFTAYYAIRHLAQLREGERILIHGAAGGVGIAAIQLAKHFGAEIFATAGSADKRDFLRLMGVDHIFDSRSLAFADEILAITGGEGVDVVLNSLAGEAINRNFRVLRPFGRFLELGKRDFYENTRIGLRPFRNNISYFGIDADQLMQEQPALTQSLFRDVMALFEDGTLHPLPFHVFEADDVVDAFRYMQQARHIGKIVVTYQHGINNVHAPRPRLPRLALAPDASYLVTGGLGGFGLRTAQWLVERGARHLVLAGRRGAASDEARLAVAELRSQGIDVLDVACDVSDADAVRALLVSLEGRPPLRGVFHAAAVIEDGLVRNLTPDQIARVFAPKIQGALNLDLLTRGLALDWFVMYSSATTLFGNPGQAAYVAANAALESLARARRAEGLAALSVGWGAIADAGFLARNEQLKSALVSRMGGRAMRADESLDILEELMVTDRTNLGVLELDWKALGRFLPQARTPKFSELAALGSDAESLADGAVDIQRMLGELSPEALTAAVRDLLKEEIGEILRLSPDKIDENRSVYDMGLDSLMGVELAIAIESRFGIRLPVMALSEGPTIVKLADRLIAQLKAGADSPAAQEQAAAGERVAEQVQQLADQHDVGVGAEAVQQFAEDIEAGHVLKPSRIIH